MLSFSVFSDGQPVKNPSLGGAYLIGPDDIPLRAEITSRTGVILCSKRSPGPAGLVTPWTVDGVGTILLETTRLMERARPYVLSVEFARGRLVRIWQKIEDWGLIEYAGTENILARIDQARERLIEAVKSQDAGEASRLGDQALVHAVQASEMLSAFHADVFVGRRRDSRGYEGRIWGCAVQAKLPTDAYLDHLEGFDFVTLPVTWRDIEPSEQTFNWKPLDAWVEALDKRRIPAKGSALLNFSEANVPDWLYIWEHDFDTIRDLAFEHAKRVISRYGHNIQTWDVITGVHAINCFSFNNYTQLSELTRMASAVTRQLCPQGLVIIDLVAPWGEYHARNQHTIPPLQYADMVVQSGISFDAFGLRFQFAPVAGGMFVRDMFQISSIIDAFGKLGRPIHITAAEVPSHVTSSEERTGGAAGLDCGRWHGPWSEQVQADWLEQFAITALSKPFVESVCWSGLADGQPGLGPHGGLLRADLTAKLAYGQIQKTRSALRNTNKRGKNRTKS